VIRRRSSALLGALLLLGGCGHRADEAEVHPVVPVHVERLEERTVRAVVTTPGQWRVSDSLTVSAGVNNLANKSPPFIGTLELRTDAATYDVIGRTWYLAAKVKL